MQIFSLCVSHIFTKKQTKKKKKTKKNPEKTPNNANFENLILETVSQDNIHCCN